ncbi:MAG TPA: hypothetical protein VF278_09590 [Pirellulales bacterium]
MSDFDETLLTAYLDGELPEAERTRVEGWLSERPERRQLLEELRSIKTSLQRSPRARLPRDFAEQVLRQAEREMLVSSGDAPRRGFSLRRWRRPAIWASLALAAGLLLMVFDRDRPPPAAEREVAVAPRDVPQVRPLIGVPAAPREPQSPPADAPPSPPPAVYFDASGAKANGSRLRRAKTPPPPAPDVRKQKSDENEMLDAHAALSESTMLSDQTLLVWCEVSPDAKYDERFRQLLLSNHIMWSEDDQEQVKSPARLGGEGRGQGGFSRKAAPATAAPQGPATAPAQNQRRLLAANQAALDAAAELVLVEASEPQIKAVLAELDHDANVFKTVEVEPADDTPRQQQFGYYRRGAAPAGERTQRKMELSAEVSKAEKNSADKATADRAESAPASRAGKPDSPPGIAYQLRAGGSPPMPHLQVEGLDATKRAVAQTNADRLQVLFVFQPTSQAKPAAASTKQPQPEKE